MTKFRILSTAALLLLAAGALRVSAADSFQTVAAISLDGRTLSESSSVLVLQLSDVANSGYTFTDELRNVATALGGRPLLIRHASARVELATGRPFRVTALNCDGKPYGEVKGEFRNGLFGFTADTTQFEGGVMAYHLTR